MLAQTAPNMYRLELPPACKVMNVDSLRRFWQQQDGTPEPPPCIMINPLTGAEEASCRRSWAFACTTARPSAASPAWSARTPREIHGLSTSPIARRRLQTWRRRAAWWSLDHRQPLAGRHHWSRSLFPPRLPAYQSWPRHPTVRPRAWWVARSCTGSPRTAGCRAQWLKGPPSHLSRLPRDHVTRPGGHRGLLSRLGVLRTAVVTLGGPRRPSWASSLIPSPDDRVRSRALGSLECSASCGVYVFRFLLGVPGAGFGFRSVCRESHRPAGTAAGRSRCARRAWLTTWTTCQV